MSELKEYKTDIRFNNISNVHRFLGRIANELYRGTLAIEKAKALAYISNIMIKSLEIKDIESRLDKLEGNLESEAS